MKLGALILPLLVLISATCIVEADLLPGWSMYFFDLQRGRDLEIEVTQKEQGEIGENGEWSELAPATGLGRFAIYSIGTSGLLVVKEASWSNYGYRNGKWVVVGSYPEEGTYPESARVYGTARIRFRRFPFELELLSYEFPDEKLDRAVLTVEGVIEDKTFLGELHHGRLRALLAPHSPRNLTTVWGRLKR